MQDLLTAVVVARDEQRCIVRCLDSLNEPGLKVLVLDNDSVDATCRLASRHPSHPIVSSWGGDLGFAALRNHALGLVHTPWVVFVDADEWFAPTCLEWLLRHLRHASTQPQVFRLRMIEEGMPGWYESPERVIPQGLGLRFHGRVHEHLVNPNACQPYSSLLDDVVLHHDGYNPLVAQSKNKNERNHRLLLEMIAEEPTCPRWRYYQVRDYLHTMSLEDVDTCLRNIGWGPQRDQAVDQIMSTLMLGSVMHSRLDVLNRLLGLTAGDSRYSTERALCQITLEHLAGAGPDRQRQALEVLRRRCTLPEGKVTFTSRAFETLEARLKAQE